MSLLDDPYYGLVMILSLPAPEGIVNIPKLATDMTPVILNWDLDGNGALALNLTLTLNGALNQHYLI